MDLTLVSIEGELRRTGGQAAVLVRPSGRPHHLAFAFPALSGEVELFPELTLDDWGRERRGLAAYEWILDHGASFPRAEAFGRDREGKRRQLFLRELDLAAPLRAYVLEAADAPLATASRLRAAFIPEPGAAAPRVIPAPAGSHQLLSRADISWWAIDPAAFHQIDIHQLIQSET